MKILDKHSGTWSGIGTYVLLALFAALNGAFGPVITGVLTLVTGHVGQITQENDALPVMLSMLAAAVVCKLTLSVCSGVLVSKYIGPCRGTHSVGNLFRSMGVGNHFFSFFILVVVEELFARALFLGLLPHIPMLSGEGAFYVLFFLGNGLWALLHLLNYKDPADRNLLRVLPQFIGGIFYTYTYVRFGLLATVLMHFASNAVLLATYKVQRIGWVDVSVVFYAGVCALVSYWSMDKPIGDVLGWFTIEPQFVLPRWQFWDYVKAEIFISACITLVVGLLLYDKDSKGESKREVAALDYVWMIPIMTGLLWAVYYLLGLIVADVSYRIMVLAILFAFLQKGASGSALARTFWAGLPSMFVAICTMQALGLWASVAWLAVSVLVEIPNILLKKIGD